MSDTNPLFDKRTIQAREDTLMRLTPMEGKGSYLVEIIFPLDDFRVYSSKWANPLRVALEAAEEALNELKCACFNSDLNEGKPMMKTGTPAEEKKDA
jgi:hypothetical protein